MSEAIVLTLGFMLGLFTISMIWARSVARAEKKLAEELNKQQEKKNELKESMETGNNRADFDNSINILHNLSKK